MNLALEVAGIGKQEMADYLGVNRETIRRWTSLETHPKRHILVAWAVRTGVDVEWLETGTAGLGNQTGRDQYAIRDSNPEPAGSKEPRPDLLLIAGDLPQAGRRLSVVA